MGSKKSNFSTFFNKVNFDGNVLTISGQTYLTTILLFVFFLGEIWLLTLDMPMLIKIGIGFSIAITLYGLLDVLFAKSLFIYDVKSKHISLHRKSLRKSIIYEGSSEGLLKLKKVIENDIENDIENNMPSYFIRLIFDNGQANIPYQLNRWSLPEDKANEKLKQWKDLLELD